MAKYISQFVKKMNALKQMIPPPRLVWDSSKKGTYIRKSAGKLT
jgi:hypothetical protein